jgi:hypothetical protein
MIKKILLVPLVALVFMSCGNSPQKVKYEKDSVKLKQDFLPGVSGPLNIKTLRDSLIGIWGDDESPNAVFKISANSVRYLEDSKTYKYVLNKDSISIKYEDYTYSAKIYFTKDTLVMNSPEYGVAKFWKFKN